MREGSDEVTTGREPQPFEKQLPQRQVFDHGQGRGQSDLQGSIRILARRDSGGEYLPSQLKQIELGVIPQAGQGKAGTPRYRENSALTEFAERVAFGLGVGRIGRGRDIKHLAMAAQQIETRKPLSSGNPNHARPGRTDTPIPGSPRRGRCF